jgi:hypothetical protein
LVGPTPDQHGAGAITLRLAWARPSMSNLATDGITCQ